MDYDVPLSHPDREALTSYIGAESISEIGKGFYSGPLPENLSLLLCTDGLFKFIPEKIIIACYSEDPREWAQKLIGAVLREKNPSQDNITAVCLKIGETQIRTQSIRHTRKKKKRKMLLVFSLLLAAVIAAGMGFYWKFFRSESPEIMSSSSDSQIILSGDISPETEEQKPIDEAGVPAEITSEDTPVSKDIPLAVPVIEENEKINELVPKEGAKNRKALSFPAISRCFLPPS
ncbi:MAG: hypothetical protein EOM62_21130 [Bacteroidia bacterium]|nr:hypothetical protein [Bacteroidia bacterium]